MVVLLTILVIYGCGVGILGTSIGLRMGYHPYRKLLVAPVWPVLAIPRIRQWAQYNPDNPPECVRGYLSMVDKRVN